jgi:tyrosyl-tRNA synthetase
MDFIGELEWRGMVHSVTPGTKECLFKGPAAGYAGFDPTAPSLQVGNLAAIMLLVHFQRAGHKPVALVGGATGMIGDPSGKSEERNLMSIESVRYNQERFKIQLEKFLDFKCGDTSARIVNNYDWFSGFGFLDFLRDVGKHLTVSYMIAKDSVKQRMEAGISYTEFSYQLLQAYDFYWLYKNMNCVIQMGGSDQWGNITSGTELIRRIASGEAFALTCPLITRADGTKFGKSAAGEKLWLDPSMTSPYRFYQFWLNCSDEDAARYMPLFTLYSKDEIEDIKARHIAAPHERHIQKALAREVTVRVHSGDEYSQAVEASEILFGKGTAEALAGLDEKTFQDIFEGVPQTAIEKSVLEGGADIVNLLSESTQVFSSKGEAKRMIRGGGVSINKIKISEENCRISADQLLKGKYLVVQKGKKNYHLIMCR